MATPIQPTPGPLRPSHISVTFTIVTPDLLRKIIFNLTKSNDSTDQSWSISFNLEERTDTTKAFVSIIQLQVAVDHNDKAKAQATMNHGLDSDQHAQALVAGDTAKDVSNGEADPEDAKDDAQGIVASRNPASPS